MFNTIKYTVLDLVRIPGIMIWALLFPLVLMSVFSLMFGPLDDMEDMDPIPVIVVENPEVDESQAIVGALESGADLGAVQATSEQGFSSFIKAVSESDDRLLEVTYVESTDEAERLLADSASTDAPYAGYVELIGDVPHLEILNTSSMSGMEDVEASILVLVMDEYTAKAALFKDLLKADPAALAHEEVVASIFDKMEVTQRIDVTRNQPRESVRYYFALLGMASLFGATLSLVAFQRMKPNVSALGARRMVAPFSHGKAVVATLFSCWLIAFACLAIVFMFLRFVIGLDFGGRDAACLLVTAVASITAMSLGCAVAAIPKVPEEGKTGILTGIVCFAALFAGLYGQPTMELADSIATNAPLLSWINPAAQIAQAFYSIMYYDSLGPLMTHVGALLAISVVLFLVSVGSMRRQRYASI